MEPTNQQAKSLYHLCHTLTNIMFQPIHIVRLDERTLNLYILSGQEESIEFQIDPNGEVIP